MLTREQIKEALAERDKKYMTEEVKREAVIDFIENTQLKAKHEGERDSQEQLIEESKR